jgi:hypothetical protein
MNNAAMLTAGLPRSHDLFVTQGDGARNRKAAIQNRAFLTCAAYNLLLESVSPRSLMVEATLSTKERV